MANISSDDYELLTAYLDNQLIGKEADSLEARLKSDTSLAEAFIRLSRDEVVTAEWAAGARSQVSKPTVSSRRISKYVLVSIIVCACSILIGFAFIAFAPPQPLPKINVETAAGLVQLEEIDGEAFIMDESGESTPLIAGQTIQPGQQLRTSEGGRAVILLPIVGRIELGADTTVRIMPPEASAQVHIERGTLQTDPGTQYVSTTPMSITTPHSLIRTSGSSVITCGTGNTSSVEMGVGTAQVTDMGNGQTFKVTSGKIAVAKHRDRQSQNISNVPPKTELPKFSWEYPAGPTLAGKMLPDGNLFAFTTSDSRLIIRDITTGVVSAEYQVGRVSPRALGVPGDGLTLLTGSADRTPRIRETMTGRELIAFQKPKTELLAVVLSPNGRTACMAGGASQGIADIKVLDSATGVELASLPAHSGTIEALEFSPDGKWLASAGRDGAVKLWETTAWGSSVQVTTHPQGARCLVFSPDSKTLVTGGRDGFIRIWDLDRHEIRAELNPPPREITCLAISSEGRRLAAGVGGTIWVWDLQTMLATQTLAGHRNKVGSLAFSQDGNTLVSTGWDKTVKVWEMKAR